MIDIDLALVVKQETSRLQSLDFLTEGIDDKQVKQDYLIPVYTLRSMGKNLLYRFAVPLNIDNGVQYSSGDVVLVLINGDKYFILGKLPWLFHQKTTVYNADYANRRIKNGRGFIELLPNGQFLFSIPFGGYNAHIRFGGADSLESFKILSLSIDDRGEIFTVSDNGVKVGTIDEVSFYTDISKFNSNSFVVRTFQEGEGRFVIESDNLFRVQILDNFMNFEPKNFKLSFDNGILVLYDNDDKLFKIQFDDDQSFVIDNSNSKIKMNVKDMKIIVSEDEVFIKKDDSTERAAKAESLKDELDSLYDLVITLVNNFNSHTHQVISTSSGLVTLPTTSLVSSTFTGFTNNWFSDVLNIE